MTNLTQEQPIKPLTKEEENLLKSKKEVSRKLLEIFNNDIFDVNTVERNVQVFKNTIQTEFYKLRSKKVKELNIKILKNKETTEYDKFHNQILKVLNELPIFLAESILDDFLGAIEGKMREKKFDMKFKELKIEVKEDEKNQSQNN
jgi:septum formation topological specificity factor MinE